MQGSRSTISNGIDCLGVCYPAQGMCCPSDAYCRGSKLDSKRILTVSTMLVRSLAFRRSLSSAKRLHEWTLLLTNSSISISVESSPFAELYEAQRPVHELVSFRVDLEKLELGPRRLIPRASDQENTTSYREFLPSVVVISAEADRQRKVLVGCRESRHRVSALARTTWSLVTVVVRSKEGTRVYCIRGSCDALAGVVRAGMTSQM